MEANESIGVVVRGIVMRPMNERSMLPMWHEFAADLNLIARHNGNPRCEGHIIDNFQGTALCGDFEGFVHTMGTRPHEKAWITADRRWKSDFGAMCSGDGLSEIHVHLRPLHHVVKANNKGSVR